MGTYVVTGSASGMGNAVVEQLRGAGNEVITVDLHDADVVADLSTAAGRSAAAAAVLERSNGRLDGAVLAAGLGPTPGKNRARLILEVNYRGVVELAEAWRPALAATGAAKVVVFSSNSTTTVPMVPKLVINALLSGNTDRAHAILTKLGKASLPFAYAASKIAISRWVRRTAVTEAWAGAGIRLNALAPGAILTPLLEGQLATPAEAKQIKSFPIPIGGYGDPAHLAQWVVFMLSDAATFLCGSVVFVDGGSDAWFRADDWPRPVPARKVPHYVRRLSEFKAIRQKRATQQ